MLDDIIVTLNDAKRIADTLSFLVSIFEAIF
jgi:hypothetical protein